MMIMMIIYVAQIPYMHLTISMHEIESKALKKVPICICLFHLGWEGCHLWLGGEGSMAYK